MREFVMYGGFELTVEDIQEWQKETFPGVTPVAAFERFEDEVGELAAALECLPECRTDDVMDEIADCFIVLCQIAESLDGRVDAAVQRKMTRNLNRKWAIGADGTGQHVEEDSD